MYQQFQINLHLRLLAVTEAWADTALSTSVGVQAEGKKKHNLHLEKSFSEIFTFSLDFIKDTDHGRSIAQ